MNEDLLAMLGQGGGAETPTEVPNATASPSAEGAETAPAAETEKKDKEKPEFNPDLIASLLTADGEDGNFSVKETKEDKDKKKWEKENETAEIKIGKVKETVGKYAKDFAEDIRKHPNDYTLKTPKGYMTVAEAVSKGFDPQTGDFTKKPMKEFIDEEVSRLGKGDQDIVREITDPANAGIPAVDAESMGLNQNSPMIARPPQAMTAMQQAPAQGQGMPMQGGGKIPLDPALLQQLSGGNV